MLKINKKIADELCKSNQNNLGLDTNQGCVIGDVQFVIRYDDNGEIYLHHISEYEFDGFLVRLKGE